jgi:hypothetical protein
MSTCVSSIRDVQMIDVYYCAEADTTSTTHVHKVGVTHQSENFKLQVCHKC